MRRLTLAKMVTSLSKMNSSAISKLRKFVADNVVEGNNQALRLLCDAYANLKIGLTKHMQDGDMAMR